MWLKYVALILSVLLIAAATVSHRSLLRHARPSWRILSVSGLLLAAFGLVWVLRAWEPTGAPYRIATTYPFGTHLRAWQVTFGFTWVAFGLLFFAASLRAAAHPTHLTWLALVGSWLVCMLPHGIIGFAVALAGQDVTQTLDVGARAGAGESSVVLLATGLAGVLLLSVPAVGFCWTWWELPRGEPRATDAAGLSNTR